MQRTAFRFAGCGSFLEAEEVDEAVIEAVEPGMQFGLNVWMFRNLRW